MKRRATRATEAAEPVIRAEAQREAQSLSSLKLSISPTLLLLLLLLLLIAEANRFPVEIARTPAVTTPSPCMVVKAKESAVIQVTPTGIWQRLAHT
jgi:hypothetical protein